MVRDADLGPEGFSIQHRPTPSNNEIGAANDNKSIRHGYRKLKAYRVPQGDTLLITTATYCHRFTGMSQSAWTHHRDQFSGRDRKCQAEVEV